MAKSIHDDNKDTTFLDGIFTNVNPSFGKAWTSKDMSFVKQEIDSVLALLIDLLNFTNGKNNKKRVDDESLMVRLAMILCIIKQCDTFIIYQRLY